MSKNTIKYEGEINLNGLIIPCYVLEDGMRVLSGRALQEALRIRDKPEEGEKRGGYILPAFLASKSINPFIESKLDVAKLEPIICNKGNQTIHGYEATVLADICDAMLEARKQGVKMTERQMIVTNQCEILIRALAKVGIIALVDEATGYQYEREKDELQKILTAYISEELLPWQKRFPDEFYKEIFRLNDWDFTVKGIQNRPGVIGTWTKQLIYNLLPKGVVSELENKTPKSAAGNKTARLHQSLTLDIGEPHLEKQLISIITLMNVSSNWKEFIKLFGKKYGQVMMDLPEIRAKEKEEEKKKADTGGMQTNLFDMQLKALLQVPPPKKDVDKKNKRL